MCILDDFTINEVKRDLKFEDIQFLNLSGRKAFHSQGYFGQGIIVAVVDTGVNRNHIELRGRVLTGRNFTNSTSKYDTDDGHGHGTHVAGSIAGANVGIAPKAEILPVKVLPRNESVNIKKLIEALRWIKNYRKPDGRKVTIVSISLSTNGRDENKKDMEEFHKVIRALVHNNIAVICSAGNSYGEEKRYPASFDEVICVGAVDINKKIAIFSTKGDHVDVCQIGVDVLSANADGGYSRMSGTSMSTPIVSGIAALIACKHKQLFNEDIPEDCLWRNIKMNTKDLGIPGVDREHGTGFCTLQPLEADIKIMANSRKIIINDKTYQMNKAIKIENGDFLIPVRLLGEISGAYMRFSTEDRQGEIIY